MGTQASGNWFDRFIVTPRQTNRVTYPGNPNCPHSWAYLPDFCKTFVQLAEKRMSLPQVTSLNFEGYTLSGVQIAKYLDRQVVQMRWLPFHLLSPFWKLARHLIEMRYLWDKPHRLDGTKLRTILPDLHETPVKYALHTAALLQVDPD